MLAAPAGAQDIVVTGLGIGGGAGDAAYDVITIDRDRLTESASSRLEDILRDAAGFQQFRRSDARSAHPTSQGATLRGLGGNASSRALILLDGVPQIDPFGGWVNWTAFDPERLGLVRITRGGGSGAFGPGALAGTIELSSATPGQLDPLWAALSYGSRDSIDASGGVAARLGTGFATVAADYRRGDGFIPLVRASRGPVDRAAPYRQGSVTARAVFPVSESTELQASGLFTFDKRDRGVDFTTNRNLATDMSLRLVGHGAWGWEAAAWLQLREFSSGFASVTPADRRTTVLPTLDQYNVPATGAGARVEIRPPLGDAIELRIGGDARQVRGETREIAYTAGAPSRSRIAGGRTRTAGMFIDGTVEPTSDLTLTGGLRLDRWWIDGGSLAETALAPGIVPLGAKFQDRSGWEPTARAGIAYAATPALTLRSAAYLGWRLPTLNELYRPYRAGADATAANAALEPERLKGIEAGADFRLLSVVRLGFTVFYNELDDAIANVTLGRGPGSFAGVGFVSAGGSYRQRQNLDAIQSKGVEFDAELSLARWKLAASYAYADAVVQAPPATGIDGLRPAQTPRHQATARLAWSKPAGPELAFTARYVAQQFEDDLNQRALRDALTFDGFARMPLRAGWSVELRGENLTDALVEAARTPAGTGPDIVERATPRTFWVGVRYGG